MDKLNQVRQSPLKSVKLGNKKNIYIAEKPFATTLELRVEQKSITARKIEKTLKIKLPKIVGETFRNKSFTVLTLGPDWWMIVGANIQHEKLIREKIGNSFASIVDTSGQRTFVEVSGKFAQEVLEHGWENDLNPKNFKPGMCTQGVLSRSPVIIYHGPIGTYHLYVRASFSQHLWNFLSDAATEYLNK
jgi:heterotetrameric sarcosine oxidase gamma subunit